MLAIMLDITVANDHATALAQVLSHNKFKSILPPLEAGKTRQERVVYLTALATVHTPAKINKNKAEANGNSAPKGDLDDLTGPKSSSKKRKGTDKQQELLNTLAELTKQVQTKKKKPRNRSDSSDESSASDDASSDDDDTTSRSFGSLNISSAHMKILGKGGFVPMGQLGKTRKSSKSSRWPIPATGSAASSILTTAARVVMKAFPMWKDDLFDYINTIVHLYDCITPAGVHEIDSMCRQRCADRNPTRPWHSTYIQVVSTMIATAKQNIPSCLTCGNKDCSPTSCSYTAPQRSSSTTTGNHAPFKSEVCQDYNNGCCTFNKKCKFKHHCPKANCSDKHAYCDAH